MAVRAVRIAGRLARAGRLAEGWLEVRGERIAAVELGRAPRGARRHGGIVAPGLCDLQVNGGAGFNVTDGAAALDAIDALQLAHGVTSYLPTLVSCAPADAEEAVHTLAERAADPRSPVEGIHLEGPFLNPSQRGVHPLEHLAVPADGEPAYYASPAVRLVTLAPELPGALELVRALRRRGVAVAIGHTAASAAEAEQGAAAGASLVTHLFNGMEDFHHRSPNVPGWALAASRAQISVIADGLHVDPLALRLVDRVARRRVVLVSDASPAAGAGDGRYSFAGVEITAEGGRVTDGRGVLAGSTLTLDEAVRGWSSLAGAPLPEAIASASERPARLLRIASGLRPGAPADLVLYDEAGVVERVMRRGAWVR